MFDQDFTVATAHVEVYDKLEREKLFKARHHIFTVGLVIGVMRGLRCSHRRDHDILRFLTLKDSSSRGIIEFFYGAVCNGTTDLERWNDLLAFGDGGVEHLWNEYQLQNHLDVSRILQESKQLWEGRAEELVSHLGTQ